MTLEVIADAQGFGLEYLGFTGLSDVRWNLSTAPLYELAIARNEGRLAKQGPLVVATGKHTGRSASDKFIVRYPELESKIWWDNNKSLSPTHFERLFDDMLSYATGRDLFVQDLFGGADADHRISVRVITEFAWHSLFIRQLLRRPEAEELKAFLPEYTIIDLPGFKASPDRHGTDSDTVIACDFVRKIVLIGGTSYAGEMKKSVFTILNYLLPEKSILPMHCSVNVGEDDDDPAIFFGLSGTGKTTLSADPNRTLIGDDEHGWSSNGLFNFEGGCYAKMIRLSKEAEPEIYATTQRFGTVLENVVMDPETRELDLDDASLAENSRGAFPVDFIPNASLSGIAPHAPKNIIMLTADAFGVMPPLAKLTPAQAMHHFLCGYTAKVAGTEKGLGKEPQATFSTCFGAPFMPRHPSEYGNLLRALIREYEVDCWLVNTGWTGGPFGVGSRMPIKATRALLNAALSGDLKDAPMRKDPVFGFEIPESVPGVDAALLDPRSTWADPSAYDAQASKLAAMFVDAFAKFEDHVDGEVRTVAASLKR